MTVRDYGIGLRQGEAGLVFNRFWRADPSRNRHTGGTGLGLAISVEDARLHGGGLDAWGEPRKGACFRLTLPREQGVDYADSPLELPPPDADLDVRRRRRGARRPSDVIPGHRAHRRERERRGDELPSTPGPPLRPRGRRSGDPAPRRLRRCSLLTVLLVTGCANIPEQSTPHAVRDDKEQPTGNVDGPTQDLDAFDLVREFIHRSGNPEAAAMYLTDKGKQGWNGEATPTIILDTFDTVPDRTPPVGEDPGAVSDDVETVVLEVTPVGRLGADHAFIPAIEDKEFNVKVRRQPDGQWRIDTPPNTMYVPISDFEASYRAVTVYYFDTDLRVTVPDLRYVAAEPVSGLPARVINVLLSGPSDSMRQLGPLAAGRHRHENQRGPRSRRHAGRRPQGARRQVHRAARADRRPDRAVPADRHVQQAAAARRRPGPDPGPARLAAGRPQGVRRARPSPTPTRQAWSSRPAGCTRCATAAPSAGPAGDGEYTVLNAAQSIDGGQLAAVVQTSAGPRLRVGATGGPLEQVNLEARTMTRPTWLLSTSNEVATKEVWTVADGNVVRVVRTGDGTWKALQVNASELTDFGPITRAAPVPRRHRGRPWSPTAGSSWRRSCASNDSASLRFPRRLQPMNVVQAVGVDWQTQDTLVVATTQGALPVASLSVDGLKIDPFDRNNLQLPDQGDRRGPRPGRDRRPTARRCPERARRRPAVAPAPARPGLRRDPVLPGLTCGFRNCRWALP